jgi:hypothetical protein
MDLQIGKTHYKTNEYLFTGDNSSGIVAESNIAYLTGLYKNVILNDLNMFNMIGDSFVLDQTKEKLLKRPTVILLSENDKNTLFIRDDIFFKINKDIQKDPVLDYETFVKLENKQQLILETKSKIILNKKLKI